MYKVLLFGGTVEGRTVAEYLNENKIPAMVCVATEYGESLLPQGEYLELSHDRLDEKQMEEKMLQMENGLVIDATHPYAQVVTAMVALLRYLPGGHLYVFSGALILAGGLAVLIEFLINLTFQLHETFFWSLYPLTAGVILGIMLLVVAICKPLQRSLHRKFFI